MHRVILRLGPFYPKAIRQSFIPVVLSVPIGNTCVTSRMEDQPPWVADVRLRLASARHACSNSSAVRKGKADSMMTHLRAVNHAGWPDPYQAWQGRRIRSIREKQVWAWREEWRPAQLRSSEGNRGMRRREGKEYTYTMQRWAKGGGSHTWARYRVPSSTTGQPTRYPQAASLCKLLGTASSSSACSSQSALRSTCQLPRPPGNDPGVPAIRGNTTHPSGFHRSTHLLCIALSPPRPPSGPSPPWRLGFLPHSLFLPVLSLPVSPSCSAKSPLHDSCSVQLPKRIYILFKIGAPEQTSAGHDVL